MNFNQARRLLQTNYNELNEQELFTFKGKLNSLYWILNGTQGEKALYNGGFVIFVTDNYASGFIPKDKYMFTNLLHLMEKVDEKVKNLQ